MKCAFQFFFPSHLFSSPFSSLYILPSRNSGPGSQSGRFSPLPTTVRMHAVDARCTACVGRFVPPHFSCKLPRWCGAVCCCGYTKIFTVVQVPAVKTLLRFQTVNVTKRNGECSIDPTEQRGAAGFRNDRFSVLTATQEVTRPQCSMELTRSRRLKLIPPSFWITRVPKISASIARAVSFCRRM